MIDSEVNAYHYDLPRERIAQYPLADRAGSKLLVWHKGQIAHRSFGEVPELVPEHATLFMNNTKVIAARLFFYKATGAKIEVFLTEPVLPHTDIQLVLESTSSCTWKCMIGNLKKWKDGDELVVGLASMNLRARLVDRSRGLVAFDWDKDVPFSEVIEQIGHIPLPPYMDREDQEEDKDRYQTVFSKLEGAVAAPTAGLHFTTEILGHLAENGVIMDELTLHVSAGTFKPIKVDDFRNHDMHNEQIIVTRQNVQNIINNRGPLIAIGTTAMRTLESLYWYGVKLVRDTQASFFISKEDAYDPKYQGVTLEESMTAVLGRMEAAGVDELHGETEIFIYPGYDFKVVSGLFTNFHMPGSTLILLVAAFVGEDWRKIYDEAMANNYRFLSYGDTSLLIR